MTIQITSSPTEAKIAKALKGLEITQIKAPTKIEFVIDAVDHYYEQLIKKKMINNIAKLCEISINQINIKGKTTEKLGVVGKEKAIACEVITSVIKYD